MATAYGSINPTQAAYSSKELLKRALPYLVLEQFGNMKPLPANNTRSIDFRRHKLPVPTSAAGFVLTEGKKRQIRRMCEMVGLHVVGLKRIRIGSVTLGKLPVGQWRYLRTDERF